MFWTTRLATIMIAAVLAGACATAPTEEKSVEQKLAEQNFELIEAVDRIHDYRIHGWEYLDDYSVIFQGGPSSYYLLLFKRRCANLRHAHTIAFSTTLGRVTDFDKVLVKDGPNVVAEQCLIDKMYKVKKVG